jgi:hypothetical protein
MPHSAAIPFVLHRKHDVVGLTITSTRETIHGLLRLDGQSARTVASRALDGPRGLADPN